MIEHIQLLSFLIYFAVVIATLSYIKSVNETYPDPAIKALILCGVWYLSLRTACFIFDYAEINLSEAGFLHIIDPIRFMLSFCGLFYFYFLLNILLGFRRKSLKRIHHAFFILVLSIIVVGNFVLTYISGSFVLLEWIISIKANLVLLYRLSFVIEIILYFFFYYYKWDKGNYSEERDKINKFFISCMFIGNFIPFGIIFISYKGEYLWFFIFITSTLLYVIAYLWTKLVFIKYAKEVYSKKSKKEKYKNILKEYKISKREFEVIELLLEGKNSSEIKNRLFLSYHTVKNHITHIYAKLSVKNRQELILFLKK